MQSDALTMPIVQRYNEDRNQSIRGIGQELGDAVRLGISLQQQQREMKMKEAESGARLQMWEVERQMSQRKLMELQAVDMAESTRLDLEMKRTAVEGQKFQLEQARARSQAVTPEQEAEMERMRVMAPLLRDTRFTVDKATGRVRMASDEERQQNEARARQEREEESNYRVRERMASNRGTSDALETQRDVSATGKRLEQLLEIIGDKEARARNSRTDPTEKAMIEQELIGLRRTAQQLGRKMDEALLGNSASSNEQPEMTVDDYLSRQSAEALKILDASRPK